MLLLVLCRLPTGEGRDTVSGYLTGPRNPAGGSGASRLPPPFSCAGRGPSVGTTARHSRRPVLLPLLFIICRPEPGRRRKLTTTQTQGPVPPLISLLRRRRGKRCSSCSLADGKREACARESAQKGDGRADSGPREGQAKRPIDHLRPHRRRGD